MNELMEFFIEPFQYPFMQRAILQPLFRYRLRYFILLYGIKRLVLMGDAISHAVLPGVVLAYVTAIPLTVGAFWAIFLLPLVI